MVEFANVMPSGGAIGNAATAFGIVVGIGLVVIVIGAIIYFKNKYNLVVEVEEQAGNNIVEWKTKGGIVQDKDGANTLRILRGPWNPSNPIEGDVPSNDIFRMNQKGKKKLRIFKDSEESFKVIPPTNPKKEGFPEPVDLGWYNWAKQKVAGMAPRMRKKRSFMKEHAGTMSFALVVIIFFMAVVVFLNKAGGIADSLASVSNNMAKVSDDTVQLEELQKQEKQLDRQIVKELESKRDNVELGGDAQPVNESNASVVAEAES